MFFDNVSIYDANGGCPDVWEKVNHSGRYIQITTNTEQVGKTLEDGLPNITGRFGADDQQTWVQVGAFQAVFDQHSGDTTADGGDGRNIAFDFDASRSNPIYGAAEVVQPKSILYIACRKN